MKKRAQIFQGFIITIIAGCFILSLTGPVLHAESPLPLAEAVAAKQVEAVIKGRSSTFFQPAAVMELKNLTDQALTLEVPTGSVWRNEQGNFCDLVTLQTEPPSIFFPGPTVEPLPVQVYAYCLNPVDNTKGYPAAEATYYPTTDTVTPEVKAVLDRIVAEQAQETFAAQLAVWRVVTGKDLSQLEEELGANYSLYGSQVDKFLGQAPSSPLPITSTVAVVMTPPPPLTPTPIATPGPTNTTAPLATATTGDTATTVSANSLNYFLLIGVGVILLGAGLFVIFILRGSKPSPVNDRQSGSSASSGKSAKKGTPTGEQKENFVKCVLCGQPMNAAGKCENPECSGRRRGNISFAHQPPQTEPIPVTNLPDSSAQKANLSLTPPDSHQSKSSASSSTSAGRQSQAGFVEGEKGQAHQQFHEPTEPQMPVSGMGQANQQQFHEPTESIGIEHPQTEPISVPEHPPTEPLPGNTTQDRLILKVIKGDQQGKEYTLWDLHGIVSRGKAGQIVIPDDSKISAPHATLALYSKDGKTDRIRDLSSKNGTLINSNPVPSNRWADLKDGDILQFGLTRLRYEQGKRQLVYEDGRRSPESLLGNNRWLIGRQKLPVIDFESKDASISVPHFYIRVNSGLEVRDLSSGNGVCVQGREIDGRELIFNEDVIQIGRETEIQVITTISGLPQEIKGWQRESWVGSGGMADVYRVRNGRGQIRALKVPRPSKFRQNNHEGAKYRDLFQREIAISKQIHHSNLVEAYEFGEIPGTDLPYLVMDYIDGPSVEAIIEKLGEIPAADVAEIAIQVGQALQTLHLQHGYVHCDVKPNNIMIDYTGRVYLADLGVVTHPGENFTGLGAPKYLPGEIIRGEKVAPDTDIYSLGQTMFQMLTRQSLPTTEALAYQQSLRPLAQTTGVNPSTDLPATALMRLSTSDGAPHDLVGIIQKCVAEKRENRYCQMADLLDALEPLRTGANLKALVAQTGWKPLTS